MILPRISKLCRQVYKVATIISYNFSQYYQISHDTDLSIIQAFASKLRCLEFANKIYTLDEDFLKLFRRISIEERVVFNKLSIRRAVYSEEDLILPSTASREEIDASKKVQSQKPRHFVIWNTHTKQRFVPTQDRKSKVLPKLQRVASRKQGTSAETGNQPDSGVGHRWLPPANHLADTIDKVVSIPLIRVGIPSILESLFPTQETSILISDTEMETAANLLTPLVKKRNLPENSSSDDCMESSLDGDKASRSKSHLQPQRKMIFRETTLSSSVDLDSCKSSKKKKDDKIFAGAINPTAKFLIRSDKRVQCSAKNCQLTTGLENWKVMTDHYSRAHHESITSNHLLQCFHKYRNT